MWCRDGKVVGGVDFRGEFKEVNCKERMSFWGWKGYRGGEKKIWGRDKKKEKNNWRLLFIFNVVFILVFVICICY